MLGSLRDSSLTFKVAASLDVWAGAGPNQDILHVFTLCIDIRASMLGGILWHSLLLSSLQSPSPSHTEAISIPVLYK